MISIDPKTTKRSMEIQTLVIMKNGPEFDLIKNISNKQKLFCTNSQDLENALIQIKSFKPDIIILDILLESQKDSNSMKGLSTIKSIHPDVIVITISKPGSYSTTVRSLISGAYDYIERPLSEKNINSVIEKAKVFYEQKQQDLEIKNFSSEDENEFLIGNSSAINILKSMIVKFAPSSSRLLLSGQPGLGKEIIARTIHQKSRARDKPFVTLRSSSMPKHQANEIVLGLESSSHDKSKNGLIEDAGEGTLYIDEIADLSLETQNCLLQILQDQKFRKISGNRDIQFSARLISASSRNLEQEVSSGTLQKGLYNRLKVVSIPIPSLSERSIDLEEICNFLLKKIASGLGVSCRSISRDAIAIMQSYSWPGNIRQLRNVLEGVMIMDYGSTKEIKVDNLPPELTSHSPFLFHNIEKKSDIISMPLKLARQEFEKQYLSAQISRFNGNISKTANFIGMERSALHRKLKILKLSKH